METKIIQVKQVYNCSAGVLWNALTEHEQMIQWFFENIPAFEARVGFKTEFEVHSQERLFTHVWKIEEVIPEKKIVYNWTYKEYEGKSKVYFEIEETNESCTLILTHEGMETFPQTIPEFSEESCRGGWKYFLSERLLDYMKKKTRT